MDTTHEPYHIIPVARLYYTTEDFRLFRRKRVDAEPNPEEDSQIRIHHKCGKARAYVTTDKGKRTTITIKGAVPQGATESPSWDIDTVLYKEHAKSLAPLYPDYAITEKGMLFRTTPTKRGRNSGKIYIVPTYYDGSVERVHLYSYDNRRTTSTIDHLVDYAWS